MEYLCPHTDTQHARVTLKLLAKKSAENEHSRKRKSVISIFCTRSMSAAVHFSDPRLNLSQRDNNESIHVVPVFRI